MTVTITLSFASEAEAAAYLAGKAGTTAAPAPAPKAEKQAAEPKVEKAEKKVEKKAEGPTADEVNAALTAVKEKFGAPVAKQIIADCGFAKLAELVQDADARVKAHAAAKAKLEGGDDDM